ncbi:MAG: hypothetical protein JWR18_1599 [Segetibacter sp.]|nr:hypothetical protein [Segetibacter sp.]
MINGSIIVKIFKQKRLTVLLYTKRVVYSFYEIVRKQIKTFMSWKKIHLSLESFTC